MTPGLNVILSTKRLRKYVTKYPGKFAFADFTGELVPDILNSTFRLFIPHKPERNRVDNGINEVKFDIYIHTVFDYPSVTQSKLGGNFKSYNRLISTQVGLCNFYCWYCFVPDVLLRGKKVQYLTSEEIVKQFLEIRNNDKKQGFESNVLRISGGEPFLAPDLILECLEYLHDNGLEKEVLLWSETNLSPFLKEGPDGLPLAEIWLEEKGKNLKDFAKFNNFVLHPCLHGTTPQNFAQITLVREDFFDQLVEAFKVLINNRIDIFPTISSNTCPSKDIANLFLRLKEINERLPLRFALVEYHLDYPSIDDKLSKSRRQGIIYGKKAMIDKWNNLLQKYYGVSYAEIPRCKVSLW
jgi:uncharacterized Fe-S cluster-containing radical SAM superfamily protein